jgi:O-antigen ligase
VVAAVVLAAVAGMAAAYDIRLGATLLGGCVLLGVALVSLPLAIALWLPLVFLGAVPGVATAWHAGAGVIAVAAIGAVGARHSDASAALRAHAPVCACAVALVTWLVLSLAWARRPEVAQEVLLAWLTSVVMLAVVLAAIRDARTIRLLLAAFVLAVVVSIAFGVVASHSGAVPIAAGTVVIEEGRLAGGLGDPNYLAASIVPALVLAVGLALVARGPGLRVLLATVPLLLLGGLLATESRGGFVALTAACVAAALLARRQRRQAVVVVGALTCILGLALAAAPGVWERLTTTNDAGNGRVGLTSVARQIAADHPVLGVGLANFPVHSPYYVREPGSLEFVDLIAERGFPVHNTYLQLLVETGPVGLLLFAALAAVCLRAAWRASRRFERLGDGDLAVLSLAVLVAMIGALTASLFLSNGSDVQLWLLLAAGPAMAEVARRHALERARAAVPVPVRDARLRAAAAASRPVQASRG